MPATDNRSIAVRFFEEILNTGDWSKAEEFIAPDVVMDHPSNPEPARSLEALRQGLSAFRSAMPDLHLTLHDTIAEGEKVAVYWTAEGTHNGPLGPIPPTGRRIRISGISWFRIVDGKIVEDIVKEDTLSMLVQLGVVNLGGH
jgi:steroid delta-isomerase-like uncharacterized protein